MIRFFRQIRQKLLIENKISKYLLYAIGEIVLVVIGILIALQINIRNEQRKERQVELKILKEIAGNMVSDTLGMSIAMANFKQYKYFNENVLNHLTEKNPMTDSLRISYSLIIGNAGFRVTKMGYENLKSVGVRVIKNDSLRSRIVSLYSNLEYMESDWIGKAYQETIKELHFNYINKIKTNKVFRSAEPVDLIALQNDETFINLLKYHISKFDVQIEFWGALQQDTKSVIAALYNEIDKNERN